MSQHHPVLRTSATCDCGTVSITVDGRIVSMFQCSCENCQTVSGTGHSSVVLLPSDAVVVRGETTGFERPAASGATFIRHFCPKCGTTVRAESSRAPGLSILPVGLFPDNKDWFTPNQLIFARSHRPWDLIEANMPHHEGYREQRP